MKLKFIHSSLFYKIVFVLSLGVLLFVSAITYKHSNNISNSSNAVVKSYKVTLELEQLLSYIKDSETGIRGYVITRDTSFLLPYKGSREEVNNSFIILKKYTSSDQVQQHNLKMLYVLINKRYEQFNYILNNYGSFELNKDKKFDKNFILGKVTMTSIRKLTNDMKTLEDSYLANRNKKYTYQLYIAPIFTVGIIFLTLLLIVLSYIKINRDLKNLQIANNKLLFSKESSDQSEILGNFSTWIWNLDTNKIHYSDNQYRLFGCEPNSFIPVQSSILDFIHPDDADFIINSMQDIEKKEFLPEIRYRIVRRDTGETRQMKSVGKLIYDSFGNRNIIGTNSDITNEYNINIKIEERNDELERSNQELASFNHVASHDLQEPLRKIQTFISRFSDDDKAKLSDSAQNYLAKIEDSATRMRVLIDDLLLFSRTNKSEKIYQHTNLNEIFETSLQELSQIIQDKKVTISASSLPILDAIPFQMQQVFNNLIGNSIKYSRPEVPIKITISSTEIIAKEYPLLNNDSLDRFHKISFVDNGMGFEQEFAERIFILFSRLHPNKEFQGTGIGLTICKKIAENHKGYLLAEGRPNNGATFNLFLPISS